MRPARVAGLLASAVVLAAGGWAAYSYGPRPVGRDVQAGDAGHARPAADRPSDGGARAPEQAPGQAPDEVLPGSLLSSANRPAATGTTDLSPAEYLNKIESIYQLRGYVNLHALATGAVKIPAGRLSSRKFYWRAETPNSSEPLAISAMGVDADPNADGAAPKPFVCRTTVTPLGEGKTRWATYRYDDARGAGASAADAPKGTPDEPGSDPPGVPRAPGLRRVFSTGGWSAAGASSITLYTSTSPADSLAEWYRARMAQQWQYVLPPGGQPDDTPEGAMAFVQGPKFCLVWIKAGGADEPTTVTVSLSQ